MLSNKNKNLPPPPKQVGFWELFDYFWDNGVGREVSKTGEPSAWSAPTLESALDHKVDVRSIENWRSRKFMPSRHNIQKISWVISGGDRALRQAWSEAMIAAWREEKLKNREPNKVAAQTDNPESATPTRLRPQHRNTLLIAAVALLLVGIVAWFLLRPSPAPSVNNIRICDGFYFDKQVKDCTKHVSVFVEGIDEVFLSFDFENLPEGAPFERWWIRNGERVTGRTSYNDEAWPGYTYWRPEGGLPFGQYVVRIIVGGKVHTQTFQIQKEAFNVEE